MQIVTVSDKRLRKMVEDKSLTSVKGFDAQQFTRVREQLTAIEAMTDPRQLMTVAAWKAHELTPGRPGVWSLKVNRNFRLTFLVRQAEQQCHLLDIEDYH